MGNDGFSGSTVRWLLSVALVGLVVGIAPEAFSDDTCLVSVHDSNNQPIATGTQVCQQASGKVCTFNLQACVNDAATGCAAAQFKGKKIRAKGHCGAIGKLNVSPSGTSSICGATAGIKVHAKKKGPGRCNIRIAGKTTDGRQDIDKFTLLCNPSTTACTGGGGGPRCPPNGSADQPNAIVLTVLDHGTDLDNGWKGPSFNFPTPANTQLQLCLKNCDATTDSDCDTTLVNDGPFPNHDPTKGGAATTFNKHTFGSPLPLIAAHVPVCVINEFQQPSFAGTASIKDGTITGEIDLNSQVYLSDEEHVCPKCNAGKCDFGPNAGKSCTVDGTVTVALSTAANKTFNLSKDCPPDPSTPAGTLNIKLPLTTGTSTLAPLPGGSAGTPCVAQPGEPALVTPQPDACLGAACTLGGCTGSACATMGTDPVTGTPVCVDQKGGLSQYCCAAPKADTPCQPTRAGTAISRTGKPAPFMDSGGMAWGAGTYPKSADIVSVATFCEPGTGTSSVDGLTGLPGPGALILPAHGVVSRASDPTDH